MTEGLIDRMVDLEVARFSANDYRGLADAPEFEVVDGSIPVMVSAPHAVTHWRAGRAKESDDYTGSLALVLAELTGCHAIVATRTCGVDPNWDAFEDSAYKQALVDHVRECGVGVVLDLHGMASTRGMAFDVGSDDGYTVWARPGLDDWVVMELEESLGPWLELYEAPVRLNGEMAARGMNTVAQTVARETEAAALQLEISSRFRIPSNRGMHRPKGEAAGVAARVVGEEIGVRRSPDSDCVEATVLALADLVAKLCEYPALLIL